MTTEKPQVRVRQRKRSGFQDTTNANAAVKKGVARRKERYLEALEKTVGNIAAACRATGIVRQTIINWRKADPEFAQKYDELKEGITDNVETSLLKKINEGDTTAIIFYLKCRAKDRGYIDRVVTEHTGPGGAPIRIAHGVDLEWLNEELPKSSMASILRKVASA